MLEVEQLRAEKKVMAGLSVVVQHADTLPAMLEHADVVVQEVAGMVNLLRDMVDILFTSPYNHSFWVRLRDKSLTRFSLC